MQVSEQLLSAFGVNSVGDLQQKCCMISYLFSPISFDYFLHVSLGLGSTKHFAQEDDERKSVSCERTFAGTGSKQEMEAKIQDMADKLHGELSELKLTGRCICLKLKQVDFRVCACCFTACCPVTLSPSTAWLYLPPCQEVCNSLGLCGEYLFVCSLHCQFSELVEGLLMGA